MTSLNTELEYFHWVYETIKPGTSYMEIGKANNVMTQEALDMLLLRLYIGLVGRES